jgi:hypothetical protein
MYVLYKVVLVSLYGYLSQTPRKGATQSLSVVHRLVRLALLIAYT